MDVVQEMSAIIGYELPIKFGERRKGDVVIAFADVSKILKNVGWECKFSVEDALKSSWIWEKNLKNE